MSSILPLNHVTKTIFGEQLITSAAYGLKHQPQQGTTLNEKLEIYRNHALADTDIPRIQWVAIGCGGSRPRNSTTGPSVQEPIPHSVKDGGLYEQVPFILRALGQDLTAAQRANYAGRKIIDVRGTKYIGYYLRKMEYNASRPITKHVVINNGIAQENDFQPDASVLTPQKPAANSPVLHVTNGEVYKIYKEAKLTFTESDVQELMNVFQILYDDRNIAVISEMAIVGGVNKTVALLDVNGNATSTNYTECIGAQVVLHVTKYIHASGNTGGFTEIINAGSTQPLFGPVQVSTAP